MNIIRHTLTVATLTMLLAGTASAQQWGDLKMKFVVDGAAPKAQPINVNKDVQFCGPFNLVDETVVVGEGGGVKNVVAYLYLNRGDKKPAVHPDLAKLGSAEIALDNNMCRFEPRITLVATGQKLIAKNSDAVAHNTNIAFSQNPPQNPIIPAKAQSMIGAPSNEERLPVPVSCNIHPWMKGYIVVRDNPYFGVSDGSGELVIKNLPVGKWTIQLWHEASGYVADVKQNGKSTEFKRGRVEVTIKAGTNDLGEIKFKP